MIASNNWGALSCLGYINVVMQSLLRKRNEEDTQFPLTWTVVRETQILNLELLLEKTDYFRRGMFVVCFLFRKWQTEFSEKILPSPIYRAIWHHFFIIQRSKLTLFVSIRNNAELECNASSIKTY